MDGGLLTFVMIGVGKVFSKPYALAILSCLGSLSAGIRPSFNLSVCSWNATDILVLIPAREKGEYLVVEAIKGDTRPGTVLLLKGLTRPDGVTSRLSELADDFGTFEAVPPVRETDRVIEFLRRPGSYTEYHPTPLIPEH